jgi:hypothetical protein
MKAIRWFVGPNHHLTDLRVSDDDSVTWDLDPAAVAKPTDRQ